MHRKMQICANQHTSGTTHYLSSFLFAVIHNILSMDFGHDIQKGRVRLALDGAEVRERRGHLYFMGYYFHSNLTLTQTLSLTLTLNLILTVTLP